MTTPESSYIEIRLNHGQVTKVSPRIYGSVIQRKWTSRWSKNSQSYYVTSSGKTPDGKKCTILLHRFILGLEYGDTREGDHINRDSLDNRDENLRIVNVTEQKMNQRKQRRNTSGYKGVSFHKATGKWQAQININGMRKSLGVYETAIKAFEVYCDAVRKHYGEFACTD